MAYTDLALVVAARGGLTVADAALTSAVAGGHQFVNDGSTVLLLQNTNAATRTVTITTAAVVDGQAVGDLAIVLAATTGRVITATFPRSIYNQTDGKVRVDYSATSGVLVAAIQIPREINR
jgi:hypothetical protein